MSFTSRKAILDDLVYRLGTIRTANGYESDIKLVTRQRDTDVEPYLPEELPALNVRDGQAQVQHFINHDEHEFSVTIDMHTTSRITAGEAENMLADVVTCIQTNSDWDGNADGTSVDSHNIDITQTGDNITSGSIDITIHYTTDRGRI